MSFDVKLICDLKILKMVGKKKVLQIIKKLELKKTNILYIVFAKRKVI